MTKIMSVLNFLYNKIGENNPLTTPLIKIDLYPCAILFVHVWLICPRSLTNLKFIVFEKYGLKQKVIFHNFVFFTLFSKITPKIFEVQAKLKNEIVAFFMTKIVL